MSDNPEGSVRERVEKALDLCRPYLQADGGDAELLNIGDDGVAEILFKGTCVICPMSRMTLRAGIERVVIKMAPEVKRVESITSPLPKP